MHPPFLFHSNLSMKQSTSDSVSIFRPWHGLPAHAKNDMGWKPMLLALFSIALFAAPTLPAQNLPALSEREVVRRQENLLLANELMAKGDQAVKDKDFETAYVKYLDALDKIPEGPAASAQRNPAVAKFSDAGLLYANFLVQNGRYGDAEKVAKTILLPQFNPGYKPAVEFLAHLEQPDYVNKTVTPQFAASRDEVSKLLAEADGYYATGRFDLAIKRYEQVLNIDRYNNAARMGMEKVNNQKSNYYSEAYNEPQPDALARRSRVGTSCAPVPGPRHQQRDPIEKYFRVGHRGDLGKTQPDHHPEN